MADCDLCSRPQPDTAVVCHRCAVGVATDLDHAAGLWPELETTIAGQARMSDPGPRSRSRAPAEPARPDIGGADQQPGWPHGLPVNLAASSTADDVRNTATTWARHILEERHALEPEVRVLAGIRDLRAHHGPPADTPGLLRWLAGQCERLRHRPYAVEALEDLRYAAGLVERAVDRPPPRLDAGDCLAPGPDGTPCPRRLSAPPGARHITCPGCGAGWDATDRRTVILAAARELLATPEETAGWLTWLVAPTQSATVRRWVARGQLPPAGVDRETGATTYPFDRAVTLRTVLWGRRGPARNPTAERISA